MIRTYSPDNIGMAQICESDYGSITLHTLDSYEDHIKETEIDLIKIDVESSEKQVLLGSIIFFSKHKPLFYIDSFKGEKTYDFVLSFFTNLGYNKPFLSNDNYIFTP